MVDEFKLVKIPNSVDERGALSFAEYGKTLDFIVKRVYWLYDLKSERGGHAHKNLKQFIFCPHGSVDFVLDNGRESIRLTLDNPNTGLYLNKPIWRELKNFKNDPQVIILASDIYKANDYIRSYKEFKEWKHSSDLHKKAIK